MSVVNRRPARRAGGDGSLPGAAVLTCDAASRRYHDNWKTVKSWSGTCRELNLTFADGTTATAEFGFR